MSVKEHKIHMRRRWYDQEPACPLLLEQLQAMEHPQVQEFAARIIIHFGEKLRKEIQNQDLGLSSIGISALANLYHYGHHKRRWYDSDPVLHKAVALLYTLPLPGLSSISFKLGDTFGLLQVYSAVCQHLDEIPLVEDMSNIVITSIQSGAQDAMEVLIALVGADVFHSLRISVPPELKKKR